MWLRFPKTALLFIVVVLPPGLCCGEDKETLNDEEVAKKYRGLIEQLVSPNKEALTRNKYGEPKVQFPVGYDMEAQDHISTIRKELQDNLTEALPYLIEGFEDKRYCMTIDWADGDGYYNKSVGQICKNIIASQLEVYRNEIVFYEHKHWHEYAYGPITRKWWERRRDKTLAELQIEAIDWAIKLRKKDHKERDKGDKEKQLAKLETLRDEIKATGKPAKPLGMYRMSTKNR